MRPTMPTAATTLTILRVDLSPANQATTIGLEGRGCITRSTAAGEALPTTIGDYRLLRAKSAAARKGKVWLATDPVGRLVALKRLRLDRRDGASRREEEALALCREIRDHAHLLQIFHVGLHEGSVYYSMELASSWTDLDRCLRAGDARFVHGPRGAARPGVGKDHHARGARGPAAVFTRTGCSTATSSPPTSSASSVAGSSLTSGSWPARSPTSVCWAPSSTSRPHGSWIAPPISTPAARSSTASSPACPPSRIPRCRPVLTRGDTPGARQFVGFVNLRVRPARLGEIPERRRLRHHAQEPAPHGHGRLDASANARGGGPLRGRRGTVGGGGVVLAEAAAPSVPLARPLQRTRPLGLVRG
jgi:hypothetical protein